MRLVPPNWPVLLTVLLLVSACTGQKKPTASTSDKLTRFLQGIVGSEAGPSAGYVVRLLDLNGDGIPEAIVYLTGRPWCGSGGCDTLILTPSGASFRIVGRIRITRPPIVALRTNTLGWRDVSVWVVGGGIQPGYAARLKYDGKRYPGNPSVPPAERLKGAAVGDVIISAGSVSKPLFP